MPTIAAIQGACTGGGAGIAACCDLRIAAKGARFGFPVARTLGNCLSMQNYARLAALLGPARVKDIIFRARLIEAEEALAIGLVGELLEDGAALMKRAEELRARSRPARSRCRRRRKRVSPAPKPGDGSDLVLMCYMSEDFREAWRPSSARESPSGRAGRTRAARDTCSPRGSPASSCGDPWWSAPRQRLEGAMTLFPMFLFTPLRSCNGAK